jgi:hypothetical protein
MNCYCVLESNVLHDWHLCLWLLSKLNVLFSLDRFVSGLLVHEFWTEINKQNPKQTDQGGGSLRLSNLMFGLGVIHRNHVLTHISPKSNVQNNELTLKMILVCCLVVSRISCKVVKLFPWKCLWILSFLSLPLWLLSSVMSLFCDSFVHVHSQLSGTRFSGP